MRIPKGILRIGKCAADEGITSAVRVHRMGADKLRIEVTDGRCAIRVDALEPASETLPGFGITETTVDGCEQLIPAAAAAEADSAVSEKYVIVDESPPAGVVRLIAPDDVQQMWEGHPIEGKYPNFDDVFPKMEIVECERKNGSPIPAARVSINPFMLADLLKAIVSATPESTSLFMDVPLVPGKAIRFVRGSLRQDGAESTALLMPLSREADGKYVEITAAKRPPAEKQSEINEVIKKKSKRKAK